MGGVVSRSLAQFFGVGPVVIVRTCGACREKSYVYELGDWVDGFMADLRGRVPLISVKWDVVLVVIVIPYISVCTVRGF